MPRILEFIKINKFVFSNFNSKTEGQQSLQSWDILDPNMTHSIGLLSQKRQTHLYFSLTFISIVSYQLQKFIGIITYCLLLNLEIMILFSRNITIFMGINYYQLSGEEINDFKFTLIRYLNEGLWKMRVATNLIFFSFVAFFKKCHNAVNLYHKNYTIHDLLQDYHYSHEAFSAKNKRNTSEWIPAKKMSNMYHTDYSILFWTTV